MKLKCLLFVLISIFLLQDVSIYATEEIKENVYFDIAYGSLRAIDENFSPDLQISEVTRGEFIKSIVSVTGIEKETTGVMSFSDVAPDSEYYSAVLTALYRKWISEGDMFYPDEKITVEQALKIAVHAIGGAEYAKFYGGWSEGYWYVGKECELLKNITISQNKTISSKQMCILLYNMLTSPTYEFEFIGNGELGIAPEGESLLAKKHDMYVYEGIVFANSMTDMGDELAKRDNTIRIGDIEFYDDYGCSSYLGYNVKVIYQEKDDDRFIKSIIPYKNEVKELNNHNIGGVEGNFVYYGKDDSRSDKLKLDSGFTYVYNGKVKLITEVDLEPVFEKETTNFVFIDNDRDGLYDVVKADHYEYTYVDSFDLYNGLIYDKYSSDALIDISDKECIYEIYLIENGEMYEASFDDIDTDIVIASLTSEDGAYKKLILCFDSVKGIVNKMNSADRTLSINSSEYYMSRYYTSYFSAAIGSERTYLIGLNGEVVADNASASTMKYAWFVKPIHDSIDEKYMIKLFNQNSEMLILEFSDKVYLNGKRYPSDYVYNELNAIHEINDDKNRFLRYGLNKNGKVIKIDLAEDKTNDIFAIGNNYPEDNSLVMNFSDAYTSRGYSLLRGSDSVTRFNCQFTEYIFVIPEVEDRGDNELYRLADIKEITSSGEGITNTIMAFDTQLSGSPRAMVVTAGNILGGSGGTNRIGVVERMQEELDADDMPAMALQVNNGTEYSTVYMSDREVQKYGLPDKGDIISYVVDSKNKVKSLTPIFDFKNYQLHNTEDYTFGFLYSYNSGFMYYFDADMTKEEYKPAIPQEINSSSLKHTNLTQDKVVFIDAIRSKDGSVIKDVSIESAPMTNLMGYRNSHPSKVTFVVNHIRYDENKMTFAYNIEYR